MTTRLFVCLAVATVAALAQETNSGCRVTGFVESIKPETKAQIQENQFRMRVVESPWAWQVGTSMPVMSETAPGVKPGDAVEVVCDFAKFTRRGRFWGTARKMDSMPVPGAKPGPAS